jgi:hypothetical protein
LAGLFFILPTTNSRLYSPVNMETYHCKDYPALEGALAYASQPFQTARIDTLQPSSPDLCLCGGLIAHLRCQRSVAPTVDWIADLPSLGNRSVDEPLELVTVDALDLQIFRSSVCKV